MKKSSLFVCWVEVGCPDWYTGIVQQLSIDFRVETSHLRMILLYANFKKVQCFRRADGTSISMKFPDARRVYSCGTVVPEMMRCSTLLLCLTVLHIFTAASAVSCLELTIHFESFWHSFSKTYTCTHYILQERQGALWISGVLMDFFGPNSESHFAEHATAVLLSSCQVFHLHMIHNHFDEGFEVAGRPLRQRSIGWLCFTCMVGCGSH